jgi:CSLREA domain-containing protein
MLQHRRIPLPICKRALFAVLAVLLSVTVVATAPGHASAAPSAGAYALTDLGANFAPEGLSDSDVITGESQTAGTNGFPVGEVWQDGSVTTLAPPVPPSGDTIAESGPAGADSINSNGTVLGAVNTCSNECMVNGPSFIVLWSSGAYGSVPTEITNGTDSYNTSGINSLGDVALTDQLSPNTAFGQGEITGTNGLSPQAVTGAQQIFAIGTNTFIAVTSHQGSGSYAVGDIGSQELTPLDFTPTGMSDNGFIVGVNNDSGAGIEVSPSGTESTLSYVPSTSSRSRRLIDNNGDMIVNDPSTGQEDVLAAGQTTPTSITSLLPTGWSSPTVMAINNKGDIVGTALIGSGMGFKTEGFLLKANPMPVKPIASFTGTANGATYTFDGSESSASGGATIASYAWDFGDGSTPVVTTTPTTEHKFLPGMLYTVTLTVTDSNGTVSDPVSNDFQAEVGFIVNSLGDAEAKDASSATCDTGATVTVAGQMKAECTLRAAIEAANSAGGGDIVFAIPGSGTPTVQPATYLPALTASGITIDGTTQSGGWVNLDGSRAGVVSGTPGPGSSNNPDGLQLNGPNESVSGIVVGAFFTGISVSSSAGGDTVSGDEVGTNVAGTAANANGVDVEINNSPNNVIGGTDAGTANVLSGAGIKDDAEDTANGSGVSISGSASSGNLVEGNLIGTTASGNASLPNGNGGVLITDASGNTIGGAARSPGVAPGNVIEGTAGAPGDATSGVAIEGLTAVASTNQVAGNVIGLLSNGKIGPVSFDGVVLTGTVKATNIGGTASDDRNVIANATNADVDIDSALASGNNEIDNNYLGTTISGLAIPAGATVPSNGVLNGGGVATGISVNVIAGYANAGISTTPVAQPLMFGNGPQKGQIIPGTGVTVVGATAATFADNLIGLFADGKTAAAGPTAAQTFGVVDVDGNGDLVGPNNVVADNGAGIVLDRSTNVNVTGNLVGLTADGQHSLGNAFGVMVVGATNSIISSGNTLSGNQTQVAIEGSPANPGSGLSTQVATNTLVEGNRIGTNVADTGVIAGASFPSTSAVATFTGSAATTPGQIGIDIYGGAVGTIIGGASAGQGNVIAGFTISGIGVIVFNETNGLANPTGTLIIGNTIGQLFGTLSSNGTGVLVDGVGDVTVGGLGAGDGNTFVGNGSDVLLADNAKNVSILSNSIDSITAGGGIAALKTSDTSENDGRLNQPPTVTSAPVNNANQLVVSGTIPTFGSSNQIVQIFVTTPDVLLPNECNAAGQHLVAQVTSFTPVTSSTATYTATIPFSPVLAPGYHITATLTTGTETSSFSKCATIDWGPGSAANATITQGTIQAGQPDSATGTGFTPGEQVNATAHSDPVDLGNFVADDGGNVTVPFVVPTSLSPGPHALSLIGATSGHLAVVAFTIPPSGPFSPLAPVRICDSRAVSTFVPANQCDSGAGNPIGPIPAGGTKTINVANAGDGGVGTFGVPADATSVILNVTAVDPAAPGGFMTVWPAGATQPDASNLNYPSGETVPNLVQVGVGAGGDISFFSSDLTDLIVDVEGYTAPPAVPGPNLKPATVAPTGAGLYNALSAPLRLCDTRASSTFTPANQCDGPGSAAGTLSANVSKNVTVTNGTTIPSGATAAVLNVTVVNPAEAGFLTAYPQGSSAPNASNLNFGAGQTTTNRVIVPLSASGKISLVSSARTDAIVDVSGYYSGAAGTGAEFNAEAAPVRICDTRAFTSFSPENQCSGEHVASGSAHELSLQVTDGGAVSDGVPADATAVVVNLTGIAPSASTFLTVFPGATLPNSSDLNPAVGETRANLVVATVNQSTGKISVFNNTGSLDVIVDVLGWYS